MNGIKDLIDYPHPIFRKYCTYWEFLLDSYEGGVDYCQADISSPTGSMNFKQWAFKIFAGTKELKSNITGNLFMHPKERQSDYNERLRMSYYYNFCDPVIDIYTNHLFKQSVDADFGAIDFAVQPRIDNIDGKSSSLAEFRKDLADFSQIYGHVFVIVDTPRYEGEVKTQADLINNGLFPYFTIHYPQNILNWSLDEFGSPYWVLVREYLDTNLDPFNFSKDKTTGVQYRLWTRAEWVLYDADYKEIARGSHNLGVVPIVCVYNKPSKKARNFLGISSIADIAFISRDIYNSCSELKQILRDQTFAFLAIQGDSGEYDELAMGTGKGLLYQADRNAPQYVSPPSSNSETYFKHIDRQVAKIFQIAKLEGGSVQAPEQSAVEQSGVSKAWDFNQTNSALAKKAGYLEDGEMRIWQMVAKWVDKQFDGHVTYPNEFSISSLNQDIDEAERSMRLALGKEFNKEVKRAIIQKKFPRIDDEKLNAMIEEMEAKEDKTDLGESGSLLNRIPSLFNKVAAKPDANSGGKKEEQ